MTDDTKPPTVEELRERLNAADRAIESLTAHHRGARDNIAAEALKLWNAPAEGETVITLNESKLKALFELYSAFIYTEVSGFEPLRETIQEISTAAFTALGRQKAEDERAEEEAAAEQARTKRTRRTR